MLHVVLVEPQIPQNTGNIGRTCLAVGAQLHLVEQFGFSLEDRHLKRAGLDYWKWVEYHTYKNIGDVVKESMLEQTFFFSTHAQQPYTQAHFTGDDYLVFGREDKGLPKTWLKEYSHRCYKIPMFSTHIRSLNLANAVAIVLYEALRQQKQF